jgi:type I restriction enzyme R subunit
MTPEEKARIDIDAQLTACGWILQDYKALNLSAAPGIAVREVPLKTGPCDYLLLVNCIPVGVVEAKKTGTTRLRQSILQRALGGKLMGEKCATRKAG